MRLRRTLVATAAMGGAAVLAFATSAPAASAATVRAGANVPSHVICDPAAGTVLSSKAVTYAKAWLPTNTSSSYLAGPGSISYSSSYTTSVTKQVSASFTVEEGFFFASAKETYGVSLSDATSQTRSFTYNSTVPSGKTAKVQVYHVGGEFGIKQTYVGQALNSCPTDTETSPTGNYFPSTSTANDAYCLALVDSTAKPQVRSLCTNAL